MKSIISDKELVKMQRHVEFYDPHPGFGGAVVPLPRSMYMAAHEMNGRAMEVDKALEKLRPLAEKLGGHVEDSRGFILFEYRSGGAIHGWRLIRYRGMNETPRKEPVQMFLPFD